MIETIFNFAQNFQTILIAKLLFLVMGLFYFVYSLIVYRQVGLMSHVLSTPATFLVKLLALAQIVGAIVIFVLVFLLV